jgi:hypothetical protein
MGIQADVLELVKQRRKQLYDVGVCMFISGYRWGVIPSAGHTRHQGKPHLLGVCMLGICSQLCATSAFAARFWSCQACSNGWLGIRGMMLCSCCMA